MKAWAWIVRDGEKPELVPWGCGEYWQLPIFHTRKDARLWREKEGHKRYTFMKLIRVTIKCPPAHTP